MAESGIFQGFLAITSAFFNIFEICHFFGGGKTEHPKLDGWINR